MSIESAADLAVFFEGEVSDAAIYTPPGGGGDVACRVILGGRFTTGQPPRLPELKAGPNHDAIPLHVRANEVEPERLGKFVIDGVAYQVVGNPTREFPSRTIRVCAVVATN